MRGKGETSTHLLLASIVTIFGVLLILVIMAMSWEAWMIPIILVGNALVWCLHIGKSGSDTFYENLCSALLMIGFFFFGVHEITLFDVPAVACMMVLVFSMFDKKRLLYMTAGSYILVLLYHFFVLRTISHSMGIQNILRLGIGAAVVAGALLIAKYRIKRRKEARKRYDSTFAKLEKAGRQNADFLSNVSHELRTPINMVMGISEVILEKDVSPEIQSEVQSIQMAGKRLSNQINNMLDYTEIVEGTLVPTQSPYMITSMVNDVITMTAMQSCRQQLEIVFDINPNIPAVLIGDVEKIAHVLKILLENSIKFTEEGGVNVRIGYRWESYGINLLIDIYDTGIGMTESQLAQICDDFYQADTGSSRFAGGLGIGLPIARGLLHAMGGFIHFDSREQKGLQVHITVPQGVADDAPAMVVSDPDQLCIACYFRPEKFSSDEVRRYYDEMILHMVEGVGVAGFQAHNFEGLLKLQRSHALTHVFIAQAEYEENSSYYEDLASRIQVVAIVDQEFVQDGQSRLLIIRKPFSALSVINLLNGEMGANEFGEAQAAGRRPFSCTGVRALAVDDEEMNLAVAKGVLGSYGMQVDTCLSGKEAVERCAAIPYDIVFLDHMMPGFDGVETLKRLHKINDGAYQERPVIALTANTISGAREMFRNEGFTEFIPKPIERTVLERVLRKVLPEDSVQYDTSEGAERSAEKVSVYPQGSLKGKKGQPKRRPASDDAAVRTSISERELAAADSLENIHSERALSETEITETQLPGPEHSGTEVPEPEEPGSEHPEMEIPETKIPEPELPEKKTARASVQREKTRREKVPQMPVFRGERIKTPPLDGKAMKAAVLEKITRGRELAEKDLKKTTVPQTDTDALNRELPAQEEQTESPLPKGNDQKESAPKEPLSEEPAAQGSGSAKALATLRTLSHIGVNVQLGLDYCCGEEEFYMEMLQMFYSQAEEKKAELISLYETGNWADYTVKVHALKSTSMTIGGERLAKQARLLEQAGKKGNIEYIRRCHPILLQLYDEICETIASL